MDTPRHWRLKEQRYNLVGTECLACGAKHFPPRQVCSECNSKEVRPYTFSGQGEVYSYSTKLREYGEDGVIVYGYKFRPVMDKV